MEVKKLVLVVDYDMTTIRNSTDTKLCLSSNPDAFQWTHLAVTLEGNVPFSFRPHLVEFI